MKTSSKSLKQVMLSVLLFLLTFAYIWFSPLFPPDGTMLAKQAEKVVEGNQVAGSQVIHETDLGVSTALSSL